MKQLNNKEDFRWYKDALDVQSRYDHRHNGEPEKYPCIVLSSYWDDPNGPYTYDHDFIYKEEDTCSHCGHKEFKFPLTEEQKKALDKGDQW